MMRFLIASLVALSLFSPAAAEDGFFGGGGFPPSGQVLGIAGGGTGDTGTAWSSYTPILTCSSGTLTSASAAGRTKTIGKTVFVEMTITITTAGSCGIQIVATLPSVAQATAVMIVRETASTGIEGAGSVAASSSSIGITKYDGTLLAANGYVITLSGVYESQ